MLIEKKVTKAALKAFGGVSILMLGATLLGGCSGSNVANTPAILPNAPSREGLQLWVSLLGFVPKLLV